MARSLIGEAGEFCFYRLNTLAYVSRPLPKWALRELNRPRRVYRAGGSRGFESVMVDQEPGGLDSGGRPAILAGLVPRISSMLQAAGHRVRVEDAVDRSHPARNWHLFPDADRSTASLLRQLDREPRGQLVADSWASAGRTASMLGRFFGEKLMAVCPSRSDAHRLAAGLRRTITEPIGLVTRGFGFTGARIEVGTLRSLDLMTARTVVFVGTDQVLW
jgi:hypothetical protein